MNLELLLMVIVVMPTVVLISYLANIKTLEEEEERK